jgi:hypothetical protein
MDQAIVAEHAVVMNNNAALMANLESVPDNCRIRQLNPIVIPNIPEHAEIESGQNPPQHSSLSIFQHGPETMDGKSTKTR